jgi:hypothetical protein
MKFISLPLRIFIALPILPLGSKKPESVRVSRRNPGGRWISLMDLVMNLSDALHGFLYKTPRTAIHVRDEQGRYLQSVYRNPFRK